ncbi:unnamed protein product [Phaeothamnion confervicola]
MGNEISPPSRARLSFLHTKVWRVPLDVSPSRARQRHFREGRFATVLFRHDGGSGEKRLIVDGLVIHRSKDLLDGGDTLAFDLAGKSCRLEIVHFPGLTDYKLYHDSIRVQSIMDEPEDTPLPAERPKVRVPRAHVSSGPNTADGRRVVRFDVLTQAGGASHSVSRRFSDFDELDCLIRSAFRGHHLESSLPALPCKQLKLLADHFDQQFIDARRHQLEAYLRRLVAVPHVAVNPDLLDFLGIGVGVGPNDVGGRDGVGNIADLHH